MTNAVADTGERRVALYELTGHYAHIKALLDSELESGDWVENGEADQSALTEALDRLGAAIEKKAEGILFVYKQQTFEAGLMLDEAKRLRQMADAVEARADAKLNGAERLKAYLADNMAALGDDTQRFETPRVRAMLPRRPQDVVVVTDPDRVGVAFKRVTLKMPRAMLTPEIAEYVTSTEIEKSAINDTYKRTGIVPAGCETAPGKRSLRIS